MDYAFLLFVCISVSMRNVMKKYAKISEPWTNVHQALMRLSYFQTGIVSADIFISYNDLKAA